MPDFSSLNFFAIFFAGFAGFVLGGIWYSPRLFGSMWRQERGIRDEAWISPVLPITASFVGCLLTSFVLAVLIEWLHLSGLAASLQFGLLIAVGIVAAGMLSDSLFSGDSMRIYFIQAGYRVAYIVFMSVIISIWP